MSVCIMVCIIVYYIIQCYIICNKVCSIYLYVGREADQHCSTLSSPMHSHIAVHNNSMQLTVGDRKHKI